MEIILKERNCQEKVSGGRVFLFIIATVLFINLAAALINRFAPVAAGFASLLLILAVMVIAYRVMTGKATEYYYILTDRGLLIHRAMGIREIKLMEIPYDGIIEIKPGEKRAVPKTYYFLCDRKDSRRMTLVFEYGAKDRRGLRPQPGVLEALLGLTGRA